MGKQSKHFEGLQETFDGLRSIVKASDVYARPTRSLIVGTSAAIIITLPFILFQLLKTKQKKTRLIATSSRSTLDYLGRFLGDVCAFIIFPLFVFNIVGLWVNVGIDKIYDGKILTVGYFIHSGSGALYLITGGLQFYTPLRQRYPKIHRFLGYVYYSMSLITAVGVTIMAYKPSGGLTSQLGVLTFLPPWVLVNILAFRAIVFFRDVELHR